jgi:hypothetical protein
MENDYVNDDWLIDYDVVCSDGLEHFASVFDDENVDDWPIDYSKTIVL